MYLEDARHLAKTAPSVFESFSKDHSFSIKDKAGRFSAVGGDQKSEQTINLSSKCSDGVIGHAKQKQYIAQWDVIYHEMMAVHNLHRECMGVIDTSSESWHHHDSSPSVTAKSEQHVQEMLKYLEERGSPFSTECPPNLQNIITKELMTGDIKNDLLYAQEKGRSKYVSFHKERFLSKSLKIGETIHRGDLKAMSFLANKPKKVQRNPWQRSTSQRSRLR